MTNKESGEKLEFITKIAVGISMSNPTIIVMHDDDSCWMQYWMVRFFKKPAIVLLCNKDKISLPRVDETTTVLHYNSFKEVPGLLDKAINDHIKKMAKESETK